MRYSFLIQWEKLEVPMGLPLKARHFPTAVAESVEALAPFRRDPTNPRGREITGALTNQLLIQTDAKDRRRRVWRYLDGRWVAATPEWLAEWDARQRVLAQEATARTLESLQQQKRAPDVS